MKKIIHFFPAAVNFLRILVIKTLNPDWIRIRNRIQIGNQPKMLDTDPESTNSNPKAKGIMEVQTFGSNSLKTVMTSHSTDKLLFSFFQFFLHEIFRHSLVVTYTTFCVLTTNLTVTR
jgi:hypothetical protein